MVTATTFTQVPASLALPQPRVSAWVSPVQGSTLPVPALYRDRIAGMTNATSTTSANAAKGATRKDASGGEAFEDPV